MKPFALPPWRKKHINEKYRRKDKVIDAAVTHMESVMYKAVDFIVDQGFQTHQFHAPSLNDMNAVADNFYRGVVEQAYHSAEDEKKAQKGRKRLAASRDPLGLPKDLRSLEQVFRDKRYWPKIMKRSSAVVDRLRKAYLQKLRRKFKDLLPQIRAGELSTEEAKTRMRNVWDASKSRVETIFRTETTTYFGKTQTAFFANDDEILGFMFDSIRDTSRTEICRSRHGLIYRPGTKLLKENTPACHYNCRSHLIALANTPHNRKLLADPDRDPERRKVVPLPTGWRK